jgi:hypothetical protein
MLHEVLLDSPMSLVDAEYALGEVLRDIEKRLIEIGDSNNIGISVIETRINATGSLESPTIFVDTILRTKRKIQLAKLSLECGEGVLSGFISANIDLPHYLDSDEYYTLEFPLNMPAITQYAARWYIGEQMKIANNEPRSEGRLIVIADGHEWKSNFFPIPTHVDKPIIKKIKEE